MISLRHQTVFVHIPKCGGQSVEAAFLEDMGLEWSHRYLVGLNLVIVNKDRPGKPIAHLHASEYVEKGYLPSFLFEKFFKFAIVRNPFARTESTYFYLGLHRIKSFEEFLSDNRESRPMERILKAPQSPYVIDAAGNRLVDEIYRLEDLDRDWPLIQQRCGLQARLHHQNKGKRPFQIEWTPRLVDLMNEKYADDFDRFGYASVPEERRCAS